MWGGDLCSGGMLSVHWDIVLEPLKTCEHVGRMRCVPVCLTSSSIERPFVIWPYLFYAKTHPGQNTWPSVLSACLPNGLARVKTIHEDTLERRKSESQSRTWWCLSENHPWRYIGEKKIESQSRTWWCSNENHVWRCIEEKKIRITEQNMTALINNWK